MTQRGQVCARLETGFFHINIVPDPARIAAAALAALIAWRTRSTLSTVVLGMLALWALQALLG